MGYQIREVQECARKIGVPVQRGSAKLNPAQVQKMRPELERERSHKQGLKVLREANVSVQFNERVQETHTARPNDVVYVECDCCQLRLNCRGDLGPALCPHCRNHFRLPGETTDREFERLRDHDVRMRAAFLRARTACDEYRTKLYGVTENRDDWREAATRLSIDHMENPKGRCTECGQSFPCETIRTLSAVNQGFRSVVERLAGISEEELERHLHPRRVSDRDYFAEYD